MRTVVWAVAVMVLLMVVGAMVNCGGGGGHAGGGGGDGVPITGAFWALGTVLRASLNNAGVWVLLRSPRCR